MDAKMHVCNEKIHFYCKIHNLVLNGVTILASFLCMLLLLCVMRVLWIRLTNELFPTRNRNRDFYSAHKSEVAGTSLFTGACSKQNRSGSDSYIESGRQTVRRLWWMVSGVETGREAGRR